MSPDTSDNRPALVVTSGGFFVRMPDGTLQPIKGEDLLKYFGRSDTPRRKGGDRGGKKPDRHGD